MPISSLNFSFLAKHDQLLVDYAARAEAYAFDDPNTSLMKTRQLGANLARHVAARHGLDTQGMHFDDVVRMLRRNRLLPNEIQSLLDNIRLRGNEAEHDFRDDQQTALANLISAYVVSTWLHRTFVDRDFSAGPFKPPAIPAQVAEELREEVDELRAEVATYQQQLSESGGHVAEVESLLEQLKFEAQEFKDQAQQNALCAQESQAALERSERDLERIRRQAHNTSADLLSFIERGRANAQRSSYGRRMQVDTSLTRIRLCLGECSCANCDGDLLLAQINDAGHVRAFCSQCDFERSVRENDFYRLDLWLSCPKCPRERAVAQRVVSNQYGYKCPQCGWWCKLATLAPHCDELFD